MSSQTPNINLTLPTGAENVSRQIINDNNTKIDTAIGTLNSNLDIKIPVSNITVATLCGRASELPVNSVFLFSMNSANSNSLVGKSGAGYGIAKVSDDGIRFTYLQPASVETTFGIIVPNTQAVTIYEQYGSFHTGSLVKTFTSGTATIPWSSFGLTSKPNSLVLTPQSGNFILQYDFDNSTSSNCIIKAIFHDGNAPSGDIRFCYYTST